MEINPGRPFFFPGAIEAHALEYKAEGFREVVVWGTDSTVPSVRAWYDKHYRGGCGCYREEPFEAEGFVRYLGNDMGHRLYSVMVGRNTEGTFNALLAHVASRRLSKLHGHGYPTVGVYFEHAAAIPQELTIERLADLWKQIYRELPTGERELAIAKALSFETAALELAMGYLHKAGKLSDSDRAFQAELQAKIDAAAEPH